MSFHFRHWNLMETFAAGAQHWARSTGWRRRREESREAPRLDLLLFSRRHLPPQVLQLQPHLGTLGLQVNSDTGWSPSPWAMYNLARHPSMLPQANTFPFSKSQTVYSKMIVTSPYSGSESLKTSLLSLLNIDLFSKLHLGKHVSRWTRDLIPKKMFLKAGYHHQKRLALAVSDVASL